MSLFGIPTASTQQTGFSTSTNLFGTPSSTMTAATQQNAFGMFGSPFTSTQGFPAATTATPQSTNITFGGFGQQPQQPAVATAAATVGLGGARTDVTGTQVSAAGHSATTPKETVVPAELIAVVDALKARIKENRTISEEISSLDPAMLDQLDSSYRSAAIDCGKALNTIQKTTNAARLLKEESRQDLLDGEMAQRLKDSVASNFEYAAPLNFLLRRAAQYEKLIEAYAEELLYLEKLIIGQRKPISAEDIEAHLKRIDKAFQYVSKNAYEMDKKLQEVKEEFKNYRQAIYGDAARFFPKAQSSSSSLGKFERIEGPSPFLISSHNAVLMVANALCNAQAGTGVASNIGLPVQQPFGTQQFQLGGFGAQQQQTQPFATSQPLFRPFGTPSLAPTTTTTTSTPFASGTLSFTSGLGTATAVSTTAATTTASPWRFSSPFNTSSSGTLFGGTATNIGAVKPLGLATPLQSGTPATSSLQLLNPPLGSKRGKS